MTDRGIPPGDAFTPELLARLGRWSAEAGVRATPEALALGLRAHGIGVVDLDRVRHLIDERVYESALLRARQAETALATSLAPSAATQTDLCREQTT